MSLDDGFPVNNMNLYANQSTYSTALPTPGINTNLLQSGTDYNSMQMYNPIAYGPMNPQPLPYESYANVHLPPPSKTSIPFAEVNSMVTNVKASPTSYLPKSTSSTLVNLLHQNRSETSQKPVRNGKVTKSNRRAVKKAPMMVEPVKRNADSPVQVGQCARCFSNRTTFLL
jgi:hypothetical protein